MNNFLDKNVWCLISNLYFNNGYYEILYKNLGYKQKILNLICNIKKLYIQLKEMLVVDLIRMIFIFFLCIKIKFFLVINFFSDYNYRRN